MFSTPAYKRFSNIVQPSFIPPSATTVKKYLKIRYLEERNKLKNILSEQVGIGLTCDRWTSKKSQSFITSTGHYITSDWQLKHCVLATRRVTETHTGDISFNIFLILRESLELKTK